MPRRCIVAGCSKTKGDGVSLHRIPFKKLKTLIIWTRNFTDELAELEINHGA